VKQGGKSLKKRGTHVEKTSAGVGVVVGVSSVVCSSIVFSISEVVSPSSTVVASITTLVSSITTVVTWRVKGGFGSRVDGLWFGVYTPSAGAAMVQELGCRKWG